MLSKGFTILALTAALTIPAIGVWAQQETAPAKEATLQQQREQSVLAPSGTLQEAITKVQQAGLMTNSPDGNFYAERPLNRAELASVLVKTFKLSHREAQDKGSLKLKDVPANYWAANDINTVVERDIMEGYRDGFFYPKHQVGRAEALASFAQAYGVQQYDDATVNAVLAQYPDSLSIPAWARKSVATSLKNGFVDVTPSSSLSPLQPMTRGAMAYVLSQYLNRLDQSEQQTLH